MNNSRYHAYLLIGVISLLLSYLPSTALTEDSSWPRKVLITNDNGIEDEKIIALAKAFSKVCETIIVAPRKDQSGTGHFLSAIKAGRLEITKKTSPDESIKIYAVDGYPADCVLLALAGILRENPPDLVVSGINGGPNLGKDWMFSGTIGAARIAAFAGIPAIAVSGLDSSIPGAVEKITAWVVQFAQSRLIQELIPPEYITVSIPRITPHKIKGVRLANRAGLQEIPIFSRISTEEDNKDTIETWAIIGSEPFSHPLSPDCDISLYNQGYIVIVPMIADELDQNKLQQLKSSPDILPRWKINDFL